MANFLICFSNTQIFRQIKPRGSRYSWYSLQFGHFFLQVDVSESHHRNTRHGDEVGEQVHQVELAHKTPGALERVCLWLLALTSPVLTVAVTVVTLCVSRCYKTGMFESREEHVPFSILTAEV